MKQRTKVFRFFFSKKNCFLVSLSLLTTAASSDQRAPLLTALFRDPAHAALQFSPSFMAAVPEARVRSLIAQILSANGAFVSLSGTGSEYTVHLARADVTARIAADAAGTITGLRLTRIVPRGESAAQLATRIEALPGSVSLLLIEDGKRTIAFHADEPLAVGSAFKLVVLRAVSEAIAAHKFGWDRVVRLDAIWRSLPSGFLQTWPDGTPLTVATLADLMISISDNTAADALADIVGRTALDALSPRNAPFPTTRQVFLLKAGAPGNGAVGWTKMAETARHALLDRTDEAKLPDAPALPIIPDGPEWYLTAGELCGLLAQVSDTEAFRINPGPADPADWTSFSYKGGSDAGVLNLSFNGVDRKGRTICASATWNDTKALDEGSLLTPFTGLLHAAAQ